MRYRYSSVFLHWLHNRVPAVRQRAGGVYQGVQMKDDDNDFEMFGDLILLVGCLFVFFLLIIGVGGLIWWML